MGIAVVNGHCTIGTDAVENPAAIVQGSVAADGAIANGQRAGTVEDAS